MVKIKMGKNEVPIYQFHLTTLNRNVEYVTHESQRKMCIQSHTLQKKIML